MEEEMPPTKKLKFEPIWEKQPEASSGLNKNEVPEPDVCVAVSPKTEPIIPPELWAKIFEDLPSKDLKTLINTCPEWNKLLSFQKPSLLFPKVLEFMRGWLPKNDLLSFRLINKACKSGVALAHPEILPRIAERQEEEREIRRQIRVFEELVVVTDYHLGVIGVGDPNEVIKWENRRHDFNQALIDLRERLQNLN